jgi:hypothetical protein
LSLYKPKQWSYFRQLVSTSSPLLVGTFDRHL